MLSSPVDEVDDDTIEPDSIVDPRSLNSVNDSPSASVRSSAPDLRKYLEEDGENDGNDKLIAFLIVSFEERDLSAPFEETEQDVATFGDIPD